MRNMIKIECRLIAIFSWIAFFFSELIVLLYRQSSFVLFYPESTPLVSFYALLNAYFTRFDSPQLLFQWIPELSVLNQLMYAKYVFFHFWMQLFKRKMHHVHI